MNQTRSPVSRWALRCLALLFVLLVIDQITLRVLVQSDRIFGYPLLPYYPPEFEDSAPSSLTELVPDQDLGWRLATVDEGGSLEFDWTGGRLGASSLAPRKRPGVRRVLLIGGSATLAADLGNDETFAAKLSATDPTCEVINFSTPLHGVDQALLRLRSNGFRLEPDEIWLAFEGSTALVATTRYLPLVRRQASEAFLKPRFRLNHENELELLPVPDSSLRETRARYLDELASTEMWASHPGLFAIPGLGEEFFFTKFAASLALNQKLERDSQLVDSRSESFRTLIALFNQLEHEVTRTGARLRVLLIRDTDDALFTDTLRSHGFEVIELTLSTRGAESTKAHHANIAISLQLLLAKDR